ncbi:phage holin family protein [Sciscionella sediminilitoris]|uniref:phage holin family protein n=1 Tax=Sciscionella sediminilitoris TaxID=1445613 RepID=UPI0004DF6EB5|nr:phage holin family protein [Sciscionella sp. SE31]
MSRVSTEEQQPHGRFEPAVPSIPLAEDNAYASGIPRSGDGQQSVGALVRDASTHLSTLVRAEVELAKAEVTKEIKKALTGSIFFIIALVVLGFSAFFFFMAVAELLADVGLYRSAAYGIVWGAMFVVAALAGLLGFLKVRKLRAPQRTIDSAKDTVAALRNRGSAEKPDETPQS